jgi:hypothetical protein
VVHTAGVVGIGARSTVGEMTRAARDIGAAGTAEDTVAGTAVDTVAGTAVGTAAGERRF